MSQLDHWWAPSAHSCADALQGLDDEDAPTDVSPMRFDEQLPGADPTAEIDPEEAPTFAFEREDQPSQWETIQVQRRSTEAARLAEARGELGRRLEHRPPAPAVRPMFESLLPAADASLLPARLGLLERLVSSAAFRWTVCVVAVVLISMGIGVLVFMIQRSVTAG